MTEGAASASAAAVRSAVFPQPPCDPPAAFAFAPDAARAAAIDRDVRRGLARSLREVFASLAPELGPGAEASAGPLIAAIEAGRVRPGIFGAYVDLVVAVCADRIDEAVALARTLPAEATAAPPGLQLAPLEDRALGRGQADRYRRLVADDASFVIAPAQPHTFADAQAVLRASLDLLARGAPDVLAEFHALIGQVVLAEGREGPGGLTVSGASTFSLWGALILNAGRIGERLNGALSLAHEATHSLLFGFVLGGRLVENPDDDLYPSPLRSDPRPMEGVVHATYVLARLVYILEALLASGCLSGAEAEAARLALARNRDAFAEGAATILANARFTPAGGAIFAEARRYMAGA